MAATTQSDIKIQNLDTLKSGSSERVSNNATTKNIRKTPSHIISLLDSSLGRSSSSPNTYNSESEQLHQPTLRIAENQVGPPSKEDEISITNITSQLQTHTYLPCKVSHSKMCLGIGTFIVTHFSWVMRCWSRNKLETNLCLGFVSGTIISSPWIGWRSSRTIGSSPTTLKQTVCGLCRSNTSRREMREFTSVKWGI